MKVLPKPPTHRRIGGFSLIEVTIAMGIAAIALVSLMGMLPRGMETLRRAADKAIEGRIHQQILGELQLTPWEPKTPGEPSPLDSFERQVRFYDDQGIQLKSGQRGTQSHVYTARIHVPQQGDRTPLSVGAASHGGVIEALPPTSVPYLRLVIVEVTSIVDPRFLSNPSNGFDREEFQKHIRTFRTVISKMGQEYDPSQIAP